MKKNFLTGLLAGLCGALLIISMLGAVLIYVNSITLTAPKAGIESGETDDKILQDGNMYVSEDADKEQVIPYERIIKKLEFLHGLVEGYYLEDVKDEGFEDGVYKGFIDSLNDPYSTYYTAEEFSALMESSSGIYCGIGATVSENIKTGVITIVKPFDGSPAYKAGILPGDILYKVNGEEVTGEDLSEVVSKMKGLEGTEVIISVVRKGKSNPLEFTMKREKIEVPTIEYQMLEHNIGYIIISEFDEITVTQFKNAVDELEKEGMKGLIVDVRNNPGGLLDSVVEILDRLIKPGLVVYTEDKNGKREEEKATEGDYVKVPMAVIINGNSASASEIFAGTLQDYGVADIIGTTSFGKGIVQKVIPLSDGTAVKLTISKYFTPKGRNIHKTGITPDLEIELDEEVANQLTVPIEKDNQLQEAIKRILEQMK